VSTPRHGWQAQTTHLQVEDARPGAARASAQYGELFQGAVTGVDGRLHRCLVSLPCGHLGTRASFTPIDGIALQVEPVWKTKAGKAATLALDMFASGASGTLRVDSDIPEGKGCGSSTADCTAAVLAIAAAFGHRPAPEVVARLVVAAEKASGNVMFDRAVLFAHREGHILEDYRVALPRMQVVGFDADPAGCVETLAFPPAVYSPRELEKLLVLSIALRRAITRRDVGLLGRVATASASINQRFLPKPLFDEICAATAHVAPAGIAVAHSGTVMAVLFDPDDGECPRKIEATLQALSTLGINHVDQFHT
jgi:uncharacterized protein involved in propanediol utilization